jgi:protein O-mannosyl-transferase
MRGVLRAAAVALAAALAFAAGVPRSEFVFDDHVLLERNAELLRPGIVGSAFGRDYYTASEQLGVSGYYRPIAVLCNAFDARVGKMLPARAHVTNIVLHVAACSLLPAALSALGVPAPAAWATALLFAVHPVHAESVAFISGRVDVLAALFIFLAMGSARGRFRWSAIAVGAASLLAFLSKEIAVVLPVLLALVWWGGTRAAPPAAGAGGAMGRKRWPLAQVGAVAAAVVLALFLRQQALGALLPTSAGESRTAGAALLPFKTLFFALGSLFAPAPLLGVEPDPARLGIGRLLVGTLLAAGFWVAAARWVPTARRALGLTAAAGVVALLPVLNLLPQETALSERLLYLASAFLLVPVGVLAAAAWERQGSLRYVAAAVFVLMLVGLLGVSSWRAKLWRSDLSIWQRAVHEEPERAAFWDRLGLTLTERRNYPPAEQALRRAVQLDPHYFNAWHNLGVVLQTKRDYPGAAAAYREALRLQPHNVLAHLNLGRTLVIMRDLEGAYAEAAAAVHDKPDSFEAQRMAGMIALRMEDWEHAEQHLQAALRLEPGNPAIQQALNKLAQRRSASP